MKKTFILICRLGSEKHISSTTTYTLGNSFRIIPDYLTTLFLVLPMNAFLSFPRLVSCQSTEFWLSFHQAEIQ